MKKIRVSIEGNGKVTIKLRKERPAVETGEIGKRFSAPGGGLFLLSSSLINQMEIRVESVFRPGQNDVEIVYALSGLTSPDTLHKFSSSEVVAHASGDRITASTDRMIEHIIRERPDAPGIVVVVHTHPAGAAEISEQDKSSMPEIAALLKKRIAGVRVIFAVHAVSRESPRARTQPVKTAVNRIKWSSITRAHEIAFFDHNTQNVEVSI